MSKRIFIQHQQTARNASAQSIRAELNTSATLSQQLVSLEKLLRYPPVVKVNSSGTPLPRCNDYLEGAVDDALEGEPANAAQLRARNVVPSHWAEYRQLLDKLFNVALLNAILNCVMALLPWLLPNPAAAWLNVVITCWVLKSGFFGAWYGSRSRVELLLNDMLEQPLKHIKNATQSWLRVHYLRETLQVLRENANPADAKVFSHLAEAAATTIQGGSARDKAGNTCNNLLETLGEECEGIRQRCFKPVHTLSWINVLIALCSLWLALAWSALPIIRSVF
jgi:hypothetical protein